MTIDETIDKARQEGQDEVVLSEEEIKAKLKWAEARKRRADPSAAMELRRAKSWGCSSGQRTFHTTSSKFQ
jgi:hypothetical protein